MQVTAFVLGLPDRYRGHGVEADLDLLGIPYEVVAGVDGRQWDPAQLRTVYSARAAHVTSRRQLAPGEIAVTVGHQRMMARFVADGAPWALILEDDARIPGPLAPVLEALARIPRAPVIVQIDSRHPLESKSLGSVGYDDGTLWRQPRGAVGTAGYLMNRDAALVALRAYRRRRVDSTADWPFCWSGRVQFWRPERPVVEVPDDKDNSNVHGGRVATYEAVRRHGTAAGAAIDLLRIAGAGALYGRLVGLPFGLVYRQDLERARTRLRSLRPGHDRR